MALLPQLKHQQGPDLNRVFFFFNTKDLKGHFSLQQIRSCVARGYKKHFYIMFLMSPGRCAPSLMRPYSELIDSCLKHLHSALKKWFRKKKKNKRQEKVLPDHTTSILKLFLVSWTCLVKLREKTSLEADVILQLLQICALVNVASSGADLDCWGHRKLLAKPLAFLLCFLPLSSATWPAKCLYL